ncbi:endonuclease/exonuclease/phosphatase family protein [Streptomyces sp. NPDC004134]|uniref:endonuclease/exonuclease/phosphatase family protein n=1 Tax=Streptomyces sp. NPDC004134 TaxID=3364691 RepID=UPI0036A2E5F4
MEKLRRCTAQLATMVGLIISLVVTGVAVPAHAESNTAASSAIPDRVMSWNTNGQGLGTPELLAAQIKIFRPQVVALQEACSTEVREAVRLLNRQGFDYRFKLGRGVINVGCDGWSTNGLALVYANGTPILDYREVAHRVDEGPLEYRTYMRFTTRLAGKWVRVHNAHLSAGGARVARDEQIKEILTASRPYGRKLILGDLNAQPWYPEMDQIWTAGYSDVDPFCGPETDQADGRCVWTQVNAGRKFDYILHNRMNSERCILRTVNEDHRVVVSDVTLASGPRVPCRQI